MTALNQYIKKPISQVFRKAKIKRRSAVTGLFESSWQEITSDVISWGKISISLDNERRNKFTFGNMKLTMSNEGGKYSPHNNYGSLWYGYLNQQRTLVQIDAGFLVNTLASSGIWASAELPSLTNWDEAIWDFDASVWDGDESAAMFTGIISGDIIASDKQQIVFNIKPLTSVFQDYPAKNLTGWTSTGFTASQFVTLLRDQTDGSGSYVFRPFFGDTTSNWDISTTSNIYANLNTSTADNVIDKNVWEIVEALAEAENFVPYVTKAGVFRFVSRATEGDTFSFEFHGAGSVDSSFGNTIKDVQSFAFKPSKFYSRVQVKWQTADTATSYETVESTFQVGGANNPWILGDRTLQIQNTYILTSTVANALAQNIYNDVSGLKRELEFTTTFIPHLDIFDKFTVYYDPTEPTAQSLWDAKNWADTVGASVDDLIWDPEGGGGSIILNGEDFKFLSFEIDLDNFQNRFVAREL